MRYVARDNPAYPEEALQADLASVRQKVESIRTDPLTPDTRLSDNTNGFNPATPGALFQLTMGGPAPKRAQADPLHVPVLRSGIGAGPGCRKTLRRWSTRSAIRSRR